VHSTELLDFLNAWLRKHDAHGPVQPGKPVRTVSTGSHSAASLYRMSVQSEPPLSLHSPMYPVISVPVRPICGPVLKLNPIQPRFVSLSHSWRHTITRQTR